MNRGLNRLLSLVVVLRRVAVLLHDPYHVVEPVVVVDSHLTHFSEGEVPGRDSSVLLFVYSTPASDARCRVYGGLWKETRAESKRGGVRRADFVHNLGRSLEEGGPVFHSDVKGLRERQPVPVY